jgi:lactate permease
LSPTCTGPWLVDIIASMVSILAMVVLLRFWQPKETYRFDDDPPVEEEAAARRRPGRAGGELSPGPGAAARSELPASDRREAFLAWLPWILLAVAAPGGDPDPAGGAQGHRREGRLRLLPPVRPGEIGRVFLGTLNRVKFSLLTIAAMLAIGYVTRYGGLDASMGLAFAKTGKLFAFFSPLLGWLGVALTGSDTSSNALFGSLQKITATAIGISPVLAAASNSSGGVMGKMIDAQSIVVGGVATGQEGEEGNILRYVFFHSIALAVLVGLLVMAQAYVDPFTALVPSAPPPAATPAG